jgi:hypothetical protein
MLKCKSLGLESL